LVLEVLKQILAFNAEEEGVGGGVESGSSSAKALAAAANRQLQPSMAAAAVERCCVLLDSGGGGSGASATVGADHSKKAQLFAACKELRAVLRSFLAQAELPVSLSSQLSSPPPQTAAAATPTAAAAAAAAAAAMGSKEAGVRGPFPSSPFQRGSFFAESAQSLRQGEGKLRKLDWEAVRVRKEAALAAKKRNAEAFSPSAPAAAVVAVETRASSAAPPRRRRRRRVVVQGCVPEVLGLHATALDVFIAVARARLAEAKASLLDAARNHASFLDLVLQRPLGDSGAASPNAESWATGLPPQSATGEGVAPYLTGQPAAARSSSTGAVGPPQEEEPEVAFAAVINLLDLVLSTQDGASS